MKTGTIFILGGDAWGYDIELFNYFKEKEILLEPERKIKIENALPPVNEIININCTILKTSLILSNEYYLNNKIENDNKIYINDNNNKNYINDNNDNDINKYLAKIEMESNINAKDKYASGIGILCNIPSKNMKCLLIYNINFFP